MSRAAARSGRLCIAVLALLAAPARAQQPSPGAPDSGASAVQPSPDDTGPQLVSGRVVRPGRRDVVPVGGIWVTLHRVGSDTAGPLDSLRTGASGRYAFHYRRTGSADAVYFVSALYHGIAYFSAPLRAGRVTGDDAEITVFDTTSGPLALHVRGRHIVVSAAHEDGTRDVVEVYELSNDTSVTLVSPNDARPTWSAIIPGEATNFAVGQGDLSPSSFQADSGRVRTVASFAPGLKQLSFSYRLPPSAFPLSMPVERDASVLEVLVEDPSARVDGARLRRVAPATIEGRTFSRFLAQDVPANAVLRIDVPKVANAAERERWLRWIVVAIAVVMLGALAFALARRRAALAPLPAHERAVPDTERLARAIAELDREFEAHAAPSDAERARYAARRAALKTELARALDARRGGT